MKKLIRFIFFLFFITNTYSQENIFNSQLITTTKRFNQKNSIYYKPIFSGITSNTNQEISDFYIVGVKAETKILNNLSIGLQFDHITGNYN